jgi:hypothetical protein
VLVVLEALDALLELGQPHGRVEVEARLLGDDLAEVLAQDVDQGALRRGDRPPPAARRANVLDVGLDHRPLEQLLGRDAVGRRDGEPRQVVRVAAARAGRGHRPAGLVERVLGPHAPTSASER